MANYIEADNTPAEIVNHFHGEDILATNVPYTEIATTETYLEAPSQPPDGNQDSQQHNRDAQNDTVINITIQNDTTPREIGTPTSLSTSSHVDWQTPLFKCLKGNKKRVFLTILFPILTEHKIAMATGNVKMAKTAVCFKVYTWICLMFFWGAAASEVFTGSWHSRLYLLLFILAFLHVLGVVMTSLNIWRLRSAVARYFGISNESYCERETACCCSKPAFICFDLCALCQVSTELDYQKEMRRSQDNFSIPLKSGFASYGVQRGT